VIGGDAESVRDGAKSIDVFTVPPRLGIVAAHCMTAVERPSASRERAIGGGSDRRGSVVRRGMAVGVEIGGIVRPGGHGRPQALRRPRECRPHHSGAPPDSPALSSNRLTTQPNRWRRDARFCVGSVGNEIPDIPRAATMTFARGTSSVAGTADIIDGPHGLAVIASPRTRTVAEASWPGNMAIYELCLSRFTRGGATVTATPQPPPCGSPS